MPARSSRSTSTRTAPLLDPHGIYGTRTANRLRASRRRRQNQGALVLLVVIGVLAAIIGAAKLRRGAARKPDANLDLWVPVAASPLLARAQKSQTEKTEIGKWLVPTADGRLLLLPHDFDARTAPETVFDAAFALHAPLLKASVAFVPCENGTLYALDWQTKKTLWSHHFGAPLCARPAWLHIVAPAVAAPTPTPTVIATSTPAPAIGPGATPPSAAKPASEIVVAGADDGLLCAMDARDGKLIWKTRVSSPVGDSIIALQKSPRILVPLTGDMTMRGGLWCLDARDGKILWRFPQSGHDALIQNDMIQSAPPAVDENAGKVFFGNGAGALFCVDLKTGTYDAKKKIGWKILVSPLKNSDATISFRAAPILLFGGARDAVSTRLVVAGSDGLVRCYGAQRGDLLWQFGAHSPIATLQKWKHANRTEIFVVTQSGALFLLDAGTGALVQRLATDENTAGAVADDDQVLAVSQPGRLQRFDLNSE